MIGDVLTSSILAEVLRKHYPDAELHYLINSHTEPVVCHHPCIDKVIFFTPEMEHSKKVFFRFLQTIKKEKYTIVIDAYNKISSVLITIFSGAKIRIGKQKWYTLPVYTHKLKTRVKNTSGIPLAYENRLAMLEPLGITAPKNITPKIYLTEQEKQKVFQDAADAGVDFTQRHYIMLNILGSSADKTYPLPYLAEMLEGIHTHFPEVSFLMNYIPKQKELADAFLSHCSKTVKDRISPFYAPSLRDFIVLSSFCKATIGNEGGAIHIANALQIPTFAIFSPWIRKETWGTTGHNPKSKAVHLKDYEPERFKNYSQKEFRDIHKRLYDAFLPGFFQKELFSFVENSLKNNS